MRQLKLFLRLFPASTRRAFNLALVLSALLSILDFLALVLLLPVFGTLFAGGSPSSSGGRVAGIDLGLAPKTLILVALGLLILRTLAGFGYRVWWGREVAGAEVHLSSRLLGAYAFAPYRFQLGRNSSDLLARSVSHVNIASTAGLNGLALVAADITTVVGLAAALFVASPTVAAVVCGYLAVLAGSFMALSRRTVASQSKRFAEHVGQVYGRATTMLRGIRDLTVAGGRESALSSVRSSRIDMVRAQRNMMILTDLPRLFLEVALYSAALVGLLLVLGGSNPDANLSIVALYTVAGLRILPAIARGLGNLTQARTGFQLGAQIRAELSAIEALPSRGSEPSPDLPRRGDLLLRDVSFSYDAGQVVLRQVDIEVKFGDFLAVTGPSGSGKSTLLSILLGLLAPSSGKITYSGVAIGLANPNWFRHVAYVPQETFVLDDSVLSNVALGDSVPSAERAWSALDRAMLGDVVRAMPEALDTRLGESGSRLSVGQRQRLGLARALYRRPAVLILDEPTAALDQATEADVMRTIGALKGSLTIILVTHRPETTAAADAVVRLSPGRPGLAATEDERVPESLSGSV